MEEYFYANMSDELKNIGMGTNIVFSDAKSATGGGEWSVGYHNIVMKKGLQGRARGGRGLSGRPGSH